MVCTSDKSIVSRRSKTEMYVQISYSSQCREEMVPFSTCVNLTSTQIENVVFARSITASICFIFCSLLLVSICCACFCKKIIKMRLLHRMFLYLTIATMFYFGVFTLLMVHHFTAESPNAGFCKALGFLDQYSGSVQLLYGFETVLVLFQPIASQWYKGGGYMRTKGETIPQTWWKNHRSEVYGIVVPWILPLFLAFIPLIGEGIEDVAPYGENGPWCWIQNLNDDCSQNKRGFWEQIGLRYIPFGLISCVCFVLVLLSAILLCRIRQYLQESVREMILKLLLLIVFMVVYVILFIVELLSHDAALNDEAYFVWIVYAAVPPISAFVIIIAFLGYFVSTEYKKWQQRKPPSPHLEPTPTRTSYIDINTSNRESATTRDDEQQPLLSN